VVAHIDEVFTGQNTTAINQLKTLFGLSKLGHLDDVVAASKCFALEPGLKTKTE